MNKQKFKYIFGPVYSWRLGISLGIDPISKNEKICSFNCTYCQLGRTNKLTTKRKIFVPTDEILKELNSLPDLKFDYITFSGRGEPTLAKNLGELIKKIKSYKNFKIAVITNSTLLHKNDVINDLLLSDFVIAKLEVNSNELLKKINRPTKNITLKKIIEGIKKFKSVYKNKLAIQIMFIEENKKYAEEIAVIVKEIKPDEVQIDTPLRKCPVKPLSKIELEKIKKFFSNMNVISGYDITKKEIKPIDENATLLRHGKN